MSNKVYDILKWTLLVGVAPTIALITGLGELYEFDTTLIVGTISLIATFLGAITGISNIKYVKKLEFEEYEDAGDDVDE